MRRYWIESHQITSDQTVLFSHDLYNHIFIVCRQQVGSHFEVITEESKAYLVEVTEINKKTAQAKIRESRIIKDLERPHIHIAISIPRYNVLDSVLERAVEMGVKSVVPFVSDYSFIRKIKELPAGKQERWGKIVKSATQQCGRGELMKIHELVTFDEAFNQFINPSASNKCLFAYEGNNIRPIKEELDLMKSSAMEQGQIINNLWVIIGSEGGFSKAEVEKLQNLGLNPVTLGQQILRVETACLTLVSVLKYEFGLMK